MTRITDDPAELQAALEDDGLILLLLSGGADTDAEEVYEYISSEMELEDWVRVFLVENLEIIGEEHSEEWFDSEEERFCCIYNDSGGSTRGAVEQFYVDGEPDPIEIGDVLDTVPGGEKEEEPQEEGDWKEAGKWKGDEDEEEEEDEDEDDDEEDEDDEEDDEEEEEAKDDDF